MSAHEAANETRRPIALSIITIFFALFVEALIVYLVFLITRRQAAVGSDLSLFSLPVVVLLPLVFAFRSYKQLTMTSGELADRDQIAMTIWRAVITVLMFAYIAMLGIVASLLPYLRSANR